MIVTLRITSAWVVIIGRSLSSSPSWPAIVPSLTQPACSPGTYQPPMWSSSVRHQGRSMLITPYSHEIVASVVRSSWWLEAWPPWWPALELSEDELPPQPPMADPEEARRCALACVDSLEPLYQLLAKLELCAPPFAW